jgi:ankyrin repeat protein
MKNITSILKPIVVVALVALSWSGLAFGGEIHDAAQAGDLAKVESLLKGNPDLVDSKDDQGGTPLHHAALKGHKDVAAFLLAHKADANAKTKTGATSLHLAAVNGSKDVAELLLANKAEVDAKDTWGETPLLLAAAKGQKNVVELLLANKADVNAKDDKGHTPLGMAVKKYKDLAELLRQHGGHE